MSHLLHAESKLHRLLGTASESDERINPRRPRNQGMIRQKPLPTVNFPAIPAIENPFRGHRWRGFFFEASQHARFGC